MFGFLGLEFFSPWVVAVGVRMFEPRTLGSGCSEGASGRTQINPIWRTWQFRGGVFTSWFFWNGFVALRRRMTTQGFSSDLVVPPPGIRLWFPSIWGMCPTYPSCQTSWLQWLWRCRWKRRGCLYRWYPGDTVPGRLFNVEKCRCLLW